MNKQAIFDTVVAHLYKQGRPALDDSGNCCYRTQEGLMCAVGCLIPDEMYREDMEGEAVHHIVREYNLPPEVREYEELLGDLQNIHDDWTSDIDGQFLYDDIEYGLKEAAQVHGLVYNDPAK